MTMFLAGGGGGAGAAVGAGAWATGAGPQPKSIPIVAATQAYEIKRILIIAAAF